jgi:type II secretory pathway pseudopilin PulG
MSIISLLFSIMAARIKIARDRAYDTKRLADSQTLQKAVELYYQDNGSYPIAAPVLASDMPEWDSDIGNKLKGNYMQSMPQSVSPATESGISAFSLYGNLIYIRGATVKHGQILFVPFDSGSGHYSQSYMFYQNQYGCLRNGSYIIAMRQVNPDQPGAYSIIIINGARYAVNKLILGGNYTYPYTDILANCSPILNP